MTAAQVHVLRSGRAVGVGSSPPIGTLTHLAGFLARTNFTVASKDAVIGVRLQAVAGPFAPGTGPLVEGTTLALVMAMAGRITHHAELTWPGVASMGGVSPRFDGHRDFMPRAVAHCGS